MSPSLQATEDRWHACPCMRHADALYVLSPFLLTPFTLTRNVCSYFHGTIGSAEANKLLLANNQDGAFMLRMSATQDGVYSVSVLCVTMGTHPFIHVQA